MTQYLPNRHRKPGNSDRTAKSAGMSVLHGTTKISFFFFPSESNFDHSELLKKSTPFNQTVNFVKLHNSCNDGEIFPFQGFNFPSGSVWKLG